MNCTRCGETVEWYPPKDRWAHRVLDADNYDVWSFLCPARTNRDDPYHHVDETRVY